MLEAEITELEGLMREAAEQLQFELAAKYRDRIQGVRRQLEGA
jgi:excinuclease UvrABC nuclease subunit